MKKQLVLMTAFAHAAVPALAQEASGITDKGLFGFAAALALCIAAFGGALAQGKIGASAMEGLARNPQARESMFVPMIISLVFVETLVLFTFGLAFLLQNRLG